MRGWVPCLWEGEFPTCDRVSSLPVTGWVPTCDRVSPYLWQGESPTCDRVSPYLWQGESLPVTGWVPTCDRVSPYLWQGEFPTCDRVSPYLWQGEFPACDRVSPYLWQGESLPVTGWVPYLWQGEFLPVTGWVPTCDRVSPYLWQGEFPTCEGVSSLPAEFCRGGAVVHVGHAHNEVGEGGDRVGVVAAVIPQHRDELRGVLQAWRRRVHQQLHRRRVRVDHVPRQVLHPCRLQLWNKQISGAIYINTNVVQRWINRDSNPWILHSRGRV